MKYKIAFAIGLLSLNSIVFAQKKPLDHTVYDSWQSVSETTISNNGNFISYMVLPQEGDGMLYIQKSNGDTLVRIARGYAGAFLPNSAYFVCKIRPTFQQTRQAKIDKKKEDEMPKDSLAIVNMETNAVQRIAHIKSFQVSEKEGSILAWLSEKTPPEKNKPDSAARIRKVETEADSLSHIADSLRNIASEARLKGLKILEHPKHSGKAAIKPEGTDLHIRDLATAGDNLVLKHVTDYTVSKRGNIIAVAFGPSETDSILKIGYVDHQKSQIILQGIKQIKTLTLDENGNRLAFMADKDSGNTALRNFYNLYLFKTGEDSARIIATKASHGIPVNSQISEYAKLNFSKSGNRLFFGTSPILPLKDTSLPEFERVKVDVWNYKEDELHTVQLFNLERDLKRSYTAMYDIGSGHIQQLASDIFRNVYTTENGDGRYFYMTTDSGRRVARQWLGNVPVDIYVWNSETETKSLVTRNWDGSIYPSYTGKNLLLYNASKRNYSLYSAGTGNIKTVNGFTSPVYDIENDVPDDPGNYGVMGWTKDDNSVFVYGKYDLWIVDANAAVAKPAIPSGQKDKISTQYVALDPDLRYIPTDSILAFNQYYEQTKNNQYVLFALDNPKKQQPLMPLENYKIAGLNKARNASVFTFTKQNFEFSPNVFVTADGLTQQLSDINKQQANYSWGTAELYKWKAYTGKETEGILYKPADFNPSKKYPLIAYFYERNNETLYSYQAPAPTPSRLNIPFFVSRGYIVFVPDVWYKTGHPGQSAYDYIVSGVRSLVKKGFVDSTKMGIQGQSWGGYQTAYLITRVPGMFAAAWAGAPVVNMFSAYGGIRWESGMNRQFQYEKTQSRIGATIWEKPNLYVENSPLFNLPKVTTPVVIMANDADGAVPWYQGIEMFTDLRRLGKPSWLLNYNGEAHNLMQRKNRKDIQIREQQFFDWLLKGAKPAPWITEGVPAIMKDKTMGL